MFRKIILLFFVSYSLVSIAQIGGVKGYVKDGNTGTEIENVFIYIREIQTINTYTNADGYYILNGIVPGTYNLVALNGAYDSIVYKITIDAEKTSIHNFFLKQSVVSVGSGTVEAKKKKLEDVDLNTKIKPTQLLKIPTVGGTPDLVQYLQVIPGVVFSGDQGGQLYIRGGSPIMNKVLLDGMTIYNPFHSIGLFSIFDADLIKSADVFSPGFGSEYGGRVSAIIDVKTKDGNKNRMAGNFSVSPFLGKISLEGPLKKFRPGSGSSSFIFSLKNSYLDKTAQLLYTYANPDNLPYKFNDVYGKISFNAANGSSFKLFGFNFSDNVNFPGSTQYGWNQSGFGTRFTLIPEGKQSKIDGFITYSGYKINQKELDNKPRNSSINGFNMGINATSYNRKDEVKYGFEINGFKTEFNIFNINNRFISQIENTTELCGFFLYKFVRKRFVLELGVRDQYYASLGNNSLEPRINGKYRISKKFSFKASAGKYSQNLLAASSDRDVVNLFYGFLSGPDNLPKTFDGKEITSRLQKSWHSVAGFDYDINKYSETGVEGFYKNFTQITNINRDKLFDDNNQFTDKPDRLKKDYIIETGNAYGADFKYKYEDKRLYIWTVYSLTYVNRFDGLVNYNPIWDRRHNANIVIDYSFDKKNRLSANMRWNFGSGFPFTQTQGFYEKVDFQNGPSSNYTNTNGTLGILYGDYNKGRLPTYHRLDASVKYNLKTIKNFKSWIVFSVTNIYDRKNIFYFDRVNYKRVNQLPILPALSYNASF